MGMVSPEKAIKIKSVVGNPKGIIAKAIASGTIKQNEDGTIPAGQTLVLGYLYGLAKNAAIHKRNVPQPDGSVKSEEWPCVMGDFECVNLESNGHRSDKVFLASHLCDAIGASCTEAQKDGDENARVQVAFEIQVVTSDAGTAGFEWRMVSKAQLVPQDDPVSRLRLLAKGEQPPRVGQSIEAKAKADAEAKEAAEAEAAKVAGGKAKTK